MEGGPVCLLGVVGLGGFLVRQWVEYKHQKPKYHKEITPKNYFFYVYKNKHHFYYLIATAEDQETKEAALAYHFIRKAEEAPAATDVADRVERWLTKNFAVNIDFKIANALETLNRFGLVRREGGRLFVPSLEPAIA